MPTTLLPFDSAIVAAARAAVPGLRAIYRYGSAGSVNERLDSDIDLALLVDPPDSSLCFDKHCRLAAELSLLAGKDVDLSDMRSLPVTLRVQIVTGGVRLFAANEAAAEEYDSRVLSDYARLNEERRAILEDVKKRGSIYG